VRQIHAALIGQSRRCGLACAARGKIVATLDGDGQNNPAFLVNLIGDREGGDKVGLAAGQRIGRKDTGLSGFSRAPLMCATRSCMTGRVTPVAG
jgi:dolichol-phosphate mannosyltransferase